jgi:hypothetical protein
MDGGQGDLEMLSNIQSDEFQSRIRGEACFATDVAGPAALLLSPDSGRMIVAAIAAIVLRAVVQAGGASTAT